MALKVETVVGKNYIMIIINDGSSEIVHKFAIVEEEKRILAIDWVTERSFTSSSYGGKLGIVAAIMAKLGKQYVDELKRQDKESEQEARDYYEYIKGVAAKEILPEKAVEF